MLRSVKRIIKQHKEKYKIPRKVQEYIHIDEIYNDGIFRKGNTYSKTYCFSDINYLSASKEDKIEIHEKYSALLNGLDSDGFTKLTIKNRKLTQEEYEELVKIRLQDDGLNMYRDELNGIYLERVDGSNCVMQDKFFTVTVCVQDIRQAREYFKRTTAMLDSHLVKLGSKCTELSSMDRLKILHDFYRPGEESYFHFDAEDMRVKGHDFKDYICPDSFKRHSDYVKVGDKYTRVMFLKDYSSRVSDEFIQELLSINRNTMLSIDIITIPTEEAVQYVQQKGLSVDTNITNWQRRQNNNNNFSAAIPQEYANQRREIREFENDLTNRNQRMMQVVLTLMITADTKEQLDSDTKAIQSRALSRMTQIDILRYQQMDGIVTVLPYGARKINTFRTLLTESLAGFVPFKTQEIMEKGGMFLGVNAVSNNPIICNRANLMNQSAIVTGVPGSGKSFFVKVLIYLTALMTKDDILVVDPEGEYAPIAKILGDDAAVVKVMAGGKDRLNAMEMSDDYAGKESIVVKSQFIMSLLEQMDTIKLTAAHKSVIDRCIKLVYKEAKRKGTTPTLNSLRLKLAEQKEKVAQELALAMELYTTGSLDIFGGESTVDFNKRMMVFDIHELGEQLKPTGLLVITDTILNRVAENRKKGKRTHIIIDEFHLVFSNEHSANFFDSAWRQFRKYGGYPVAISQNISKLLDDIRASTMVANSEFVVSFNQSAIDREKLKVLLNLSQEHLAYITNAQPGCGVLRYGAATVPFKNVFPQDTMLYKLMTTKLGEGEYGQAV